MADGLPTSSLPTANAWEGVPADVLASLEREAFGLERVGYDVPLPNGCFKCIGCGVILPRHLDWNQCGDCDTRTPEDY